MNFVVFAFVWGGIQGLRAFTGHGVARIVTMELVTVVLSVPMSV